MLPNTCFSLCLYENGKIMSEEHGVWVTEKAENISRQEYAYCLELSFVSRSHVPTELRHQVLFVL